MARVLPPDLASLDVLNRQCHRRALPACAFLARVLRIARASLDRVLSKTAAASLRSYSTGSYLVLIKRVLLYTSNPPWQASRPNLVTLPTRRHLGGESKSPRGLKRFAYSVVCNGLPKQFYLSIYRRRDIS